MNLWLCHFAFPTYPLAIAIFIFSKWHIKNSYLKSRRKKYFLLISFCWITRTVYQWTWHHGILLWAFYSPPPLSSPPPQTLQTPPPTPWRVSLSIIWDILRSILLTNVFQFCFYHCEMFLLHFYHSLILNGF